MTDRPLDADERAELERLRAERARSKPPPARPRAKAFRWTASVTVLVLATLLMLVATVAVFARNELLNTDRYVQTVAPLAEHREIRAAVSARITTVVTDRLELEELTANAIEAIQTRGAPDSLDALAVPLASAVNSFIGDQVEAIVYSDRFAELWVAANQTAHRSVVALLTGEKPEALVVDGDMLYLDLGPVVQQVKTRLVDEGFTVAERLPDVATQFPLAEVRGLANARAMAALLDTLVWLLPVAAMVLFAVGVYLAPLRRRGLLIGAMFIAAAMLLLLGGLRAGRAVMLANLPETVESPQAVAAVFDIMTRFLASAAQTLCVLALLVAVGAWLAGPGAIPVGIRGALANLRDATATGLDRIGVSFGQVPGFTTGYKRALKFGLALLGLVWLALWRHPGVSGVLWVSAVVLLAMAVVEVVAKLPVDAGDAKAEREPV